MDKEAAEPPLVVRSGLYTGPTMDTPGASKDKTRKVEKPVVATKAPVSRKPAAAVKRVTPPPAPVVKPAPMPRIVVVEVIQGSKRATQNFEEKEPKGEPTPNPSEPN